MLIHLTYRYRFVENKNLENPITQTLKRNHPINNNVEHFVLSVAERHNCGGRGGEGGVGVGWGEGGREKIDKLAEL